MGLKHNSKTPPNESESYGSWLKANESALPNLAYADSIKKTYPHHIIVGGKKAGNRIVGGTMYLSKKGLERAWKYATRDARGFKTSHSASLIVVGHLLSHMRALKMDTSAHESFRKKLDKQVTSKRTGKKEATPRMSRKTKVVSKSVVKKPPKATNKVQEHLENYVSI